MFSANVPAAEIKTNYVHHYKCFKCIGMKPILSSVSVQQQLYDINILRAALW